MSAVKAKVLELLVYDDIGENYWTGLGITPATVAAAIKAAGQYDSIVLRINSPGGSCFDGVAIYNLLRSQNKPIDVFVDGIAASAASVVAMAGDTINMGTGAMLMIHNAAWGCYGDAQALRASADTIETISVTVGEIYVKRAHIDATELKGLMDAETWMGGEEAVERGFATKTVERDDAAVAEARALTQSFNMKAFKHAPKFEAPKEGIRNESVDSNCTCECTPCRTIGCSGCENDPCQAEGCDCPAHEGEMSGAAEIEIYSKRLALRERAA